MPFRLLHGHTSPETAYIIHDYPFGFRLRCIKRVWIDTCQKGKRVGQQRLMEQTTTKDYNIGYNPEESHTLPLPTEWNNPKVSTYSDILILYILEGGDSDGYVKHDSLIVYASPQQFSNFISRYSTQFDDTEKKRIEILLEYSKKHSPESWKRYEMVTNPIGNKYGTDE